MNSYKSRAPGVAIFSPMSTSQEFALLFRPTRALDPDELPRRNAVARDWALALGNGGALVHASPLEAAGFTVTQNGVAIVHHERAIASVLVIRAPDLETALTLAKGHPGLAFGTEIEVRPLKAVGVSPRTGEAESVPVTPRWSPGTPGDGSRAP
jgi:hypothetical protein